MNFHSNFEFLKVFVAVIVRFSKGICFFFKFYFLVLLALDFTAWICWSFNFTWISDWNLCDLRWHRIIFDKFAWEIVIWFFCNYLVVEECWETRSKDKSALTYSPPWPCMHFLKYCIWVPIMDRLCTQVNTLSNTGHTSIILRFGPRFSRFHHWFTVSSKHHRRTKISPPSPPPPPLPNSPTFRRKSQQPRTFHIFWSKISIKRLRIKIKIIIPCPSSLVKKISYHLYNNRWRTI